MAETQEDCVPILEQLMRRGGTVGIDTETTGLDRMRDIVLFWSLATEDSRWCLPAKMLPFFDPIFAKKDVNWCLANAKYDMHLLKNMGIHLSGRCDDILIMDALVDDTRPHGLKEQAKLAYEARWGDFKQLFLDPVVVSQVLAYDKDQARGFKQLGVGDKLLRVYDSNPSMVIEYASCDAYFTYMRWNDLRKELAAEELPVEVAAGFTTLLDYFEVIEAPLTTCLFNMERRGVSVDVDYIDKIDGPIRDGIRALEKELCDIARYGHNPSSHDQVRSTLYDEKHFGLNAVLYTKPKRGEPKESTNDKSLDILLERMDPSSVAAKYIVKLQEHRKLTKLHRTYVKGIRKHLGPDGKIHTDTKQHVARTGRLSSTDPNMQNIPRPDAESDPYLIRGAFVASEGTVLIDKDYPQIEFRVAAVNAKEEKMLEAIHKGWDIHNANTVNMFPGVVYEELAAARKKSKGELTQAEMSLLTKRQQSKATGLGTLFGEGARKIAAQLGINVNAAYRLKDQFFNTYPGIEANIAFMHEYGHEFGYSFTALGRCRRLHKINNEYSRFLVAEEERQAYNHGIQGSASELIKLAMLQIDSCEMMKQLDGHLILTVHDELLMEAPPMTASDVSDLMHEYMSNPIQWGPLSIPYPVPIEPDGEIGHRWSECH
jgi:DNA polymerase-1